MKPIPYGRQSIDQADIDAVIQTLKSDYLTQGPKITEFENNFATYIGARYAVAVSNGTTALHLAALALNVNSSSKVITTPITFVASANCVRYCGGEVDFVDIDQDNYLLDLNKLEDKVKKDKIDGVIPVDFAGYPINSEELSYLSKKYGFWIIEDACHAPGASFVDSKKNQIRSGDCKYVDMSIFSFHPVKHIACGEGGMITTNNEVLYKKLQLYRTHGITKENFKLNSDGPWYYEMQELGFNYRMPDILAALGVSQLKKADLGIERRIAIANRYNNEFKNLSEIKLPSVSEGINHAYHLYVIQLEKRAELYEYLRSNNIFCQVHYIPVHLQTYYRSLGFKEGDFPVAENYYQGTLSLPMYPSLKDEEQAFIISKIKNFLKA